MADHPRTSRAIDRNRDSRSKSPSKNHSRSHRTRSTHRHQHHHRHAPSTSIDSKELPYNSRQLTKRDLDAFKPMFALYLDIQKGKELEDMDDTEVKGRWKSFVGKWNRGELSEGWYDPSTLHKAVSQTFPAASKEAEAGPDPTARAGRDAKTSAEDEDSGSDDSMGPTLPGQESRSRGRRAGPSIPNLQDLELKKELDAEDQQARRKDIGFERKTDRKEQKAALDELVPRAEAGTRERQLEKKKEINEKMKSFREKSPGAAEVPDTELMGGGDGIEGYKKQKQEFERKKNERELRKEEILRARMAEREERLQEYRSKEEDTMSMLKALAKQRFGG